MNASTKIISASGNIAVVNIPMRNFPAIAIQGDTLHSMYQDLEIIASNIKSGKITFALDEMDGLIAKFSEILEFYEKSLTTNNITLPYQKTT